MEKLCIRFQCRKCEHNLVIDKDKPKHIYSLNEYDCPSCGEEGYENWIYLGESEELPSPEIEMLPDSEIDTNGLRALCEEYIENKDNEDTDWKHYIFEEAMETFYGELIWDKLKKIQPL